MGRTIAGQILGGLDGDGSVEPILTNRRHESHSLGAMSNTHWLPLVLVFGLKLDLTRTLLHTNQDGTIDESEGIFPNKYSTFTPRMLKALFNFMFVAKEPAAYVHNPDYVLQLMYDSIEDLSALSGVTTDGLIRP